MSPPAHSPAVRQLHPRDDAIVALRPLRAGEAVTAGGRLITLAEDIPAKQKFAARPFAEGERVTLYGVTVGVTLRPVPLGGLFSTGNLVHAADPCHGRLSPVRWEPPDVSAWRAATFQGYARPDGPAGVANFWVVIPLVFCESRNLLMMREALTDALGYAHASPYRRLVSTMAGRWQLGQDWSAATLEDPPAPPARPFPHVDGIKFLNHGLGCGGTRDDARALCGLLAGYVTHPNVAGATVLSLGCQHAQVDMLTEEIFRRSPRFQRPLHVFEQQKSASERDMLQQALKATFGSLAQANDLRRRPAPLSDLTLGVECGGSDGFSGLSANPALGHCADLLAALGGGVLLSEFPELCGIEQSLCDRCEDDALAARFLHLMRRYQEAARACGSGFEMNPSPGNIRDGLITDAMKSAGAALKGGSSPVIDVIDYPGQALRRGGLTLLCTPGNDVESTTALAAAGCQLIAFTTGLGTPTGNPVAPTLKIATHSDLARRLPDIIDFDAGPVLDGTRSAAQLGAAIFERLLEVASGLRQTCATRLGQDDFLPWKRGVSL